MSDPLKFGLALQAGVAAVLVIASRLDVLPFDAATYAFPALLVIGVLTAAFYRFGKQRLIIGQEAVNWGIAFAVHFASAIVLFWIVRALAK